MTAESGEGRVMAPSIAVFVGVVGGIALLAAVFLCAFRKKAKKRPIKATETLDLFERDPSFYSSNDHHG